MKTNRLLIVAASLAFALSLSSCSESTSGGSNPNYYKLSGALKYKKSLKIPSSAKLYVLWVVSSGSPDYGYVYGKGTINTTSNTFSVTFNSAPPAEALNNNQLGVAYVMLLDTTLAEGKLMDDHGLYDSTVFFGAINDHAIIYVNGNPDTANSYRNWVKDFNFKTGYNFGKGWYNPGPGFDGFEPDPLPAELWIDDSTEDFIFPNWT